MSKELENTLQEFGFTPVASFSHSTQYLYWTTSTLLHKSIRSKYENGELVFEITHIRKGENSTPIGLDMMVVYGEEGIIELLYRWFSDKEVPVSYQTDRILTFKTLLQKFYGEDLKQDPIR